jgi:hypothetical protein
MKDMATPSYVATVLRVTSGTELHQQTWAEGN